MRMSGDGERIPEAAPASAPRAVDGGARPRELSSGALLKEIARELRHLVRAQIDLARAEVRASVAAEARMAAGLGVAAVTALVGATLLLVTAIMGLATVLPGWAAGLIVSAVVLAASAVVGVMGWRRRVRRPLAKTRHEIEEDVKWTKERVF